MAALTQAVKDHWKAEMKRLNAELPDVVIEAAIDLFEKDPDAFAAEVDSLLERRKAQAGTPVESYAVPKETLIEGRVLKQGTAEWEEHMQKISESSVAKTEDADHDSAQDGSA